MDDLFKPIKTARKVQHNIDKLETLSLSGTPASQPASSKSKISIIGSDSEEPSGVTSEPFSLRPSGNSLQSSSSAYSSYEKHKRYDSTAFLQKSYLKENAPASLPDDAREILKSQPDNGDLAAVLQYLQYGIDGKHDFDVRLPSPKASQIVNILVTVTIPDQWLRLRGASLPKSDDQLKKSLLACLNSVAGIGALLMQIRRLSSVSSDQKNPFLEDAVSVLSTVLAGSQVLSIFLRDAITLFKTEIQRRVFWQEVTTLLAGSKVFATMAQVFATTRSLRDQNTSTWLGDGPEYSRWLSRNISTAATSLNASIPSDNQKLNMLCPVLKRGLSLGYRDPLVTELYTSLLLGKSVLWTTVHDLVQSLPTYDQTGLFDIILRDLASKFLRDSPGVVQEKDVLLKNATVIGGVSAMITGLVQNNSLLEAHVLQRLTSTSGEYSGLGLDTRRAVIATLASSQEKLGELLDKSLEHFGNKLQIQHEPILQQESTAQTILLAIGYLNHVNHESAKQISSSTTFLRMVSNRLSASVPRARFLGMIVAVAMSRLVDEPDKVMNFGVEEMEGEEARRWLELVSIRDRVGELDDLPKEPVEPEKQQPVESTLRYVRQKRVPVQSQPQSSKIIAIEEVSHSDQDVDVDEDPDLRPYALPDSDPSDSDEDPTLVHRDKPTVPVYITSLIKQLNIPDDPSTIELALKAAPSLIRRKANFGDELSSNILQLASSLLNLREGMSKEEMQQMRLEALIACLVSKPGVMGPWIASMYFEGDFSIAQRAALLTAMALGAREIAGIDDEIERPSTTSNLADSSFPSSRLPSHLEETYSVNASPLDTLSINLSHRTLQPMALSAADKITGPNVLKIRTFSSRMAVAAKEAAKIEARSKRIPKELHKFLAESMCLPFCSRLALLLSSLISSPYLASSTLLHPSLLKLSLQTLIVLTSTIGPNALQLPPLTRETLLLLTTLHTIPSLAHDPIVLPTILHLLLTLLDLNIEAGSTAEERLVTDFGPMIAELVSWAAALGDRASIPEIRDDPSVGMAMPWPVLVAGIQVKWQEVGRKFQGRMLGLIAGTEFDSF
ncbi:uncharacterized protein Z518_09462 [Rhinocladiella mackenziei CBS 650.93]|uniref:Telomere length regulation protein conserved domain-containing protein n=1 Tax=Rhinocladiella mackenziei CBS 650.93 TaxID=1442369 RepID=A0A0D2IEP8_9EURO|nr:uncharacterized protein Z518_09462 [Rhinocladiella mackenziei CBS 650.93]KIX01736.1 hypothetical protein Z518_09462 [Rhinocladiella mackenziei CBS 650.93]